MTDELVLIGTDTRIGHVYAFEKESGTMRWKYRVPGSGASTDILRTGSKIYTVVDGDELICLDLFTGRLLWSFKDSLYRETHLLFTQSAALANGRVFLGTNRGLVFALDAESGKLIWKTAVSGRISTSVVARRGEIFFGTGDSFLFRLSQEAGEIKTSYFTAVTPVGRPTLAGSGFYVFLNSMGGAGLGEQLLAVDLNFENELWHHESNTIWSATKSHIFNHLLLTGFENGRIVAYDLNNGDQVWEINLKGEVRSLNNEGNVIYVGTVPGVVYAVLKEE